MVKNGPVLSPWALLRSFEGRRVRGLRFAAAFARLRTLRYSAESIFLRAALLYARSLTRAAVDLQLAVVLGHCVTGLAVSLGGFREPAAYLVGHDQRTKLRGVNEPVRGALFSCS